MPFGSEALVAGPYTCTWNGTSLGIFQGDNDVPTIVHQHRAVPIDKTDKYGALKIDSLHHGMSFMFQGVLMEYAKALAVIYPFGTFGGNVGVIGKLKFSMCQALVLTAVAGTTAATAPATLTAGKTIAADDMVTQLMYGPQLRVVPIKLEMYPYDVGGGTVGFFVMT